MGLDMYLDREIYIGNDYKEEKDQVVIDVPGVNQSKVSAIIEHVGYWRKANAVHKWFVDNVQNGTDDCGRYYVSQENLKDLLELVNKVLNDKSLAGEALPSESGFFFGSTDLDEWYFEGLEDTKKIIEDALKDDNFSYYYHSSW